MLNLTVVGNLGAQPTVGTTLKGAAIATMRVAVNQSRTDPSTGERTESTEWFRVRAMGRLVDVAERLTKGTRVLVIGRLDIGHYQSSEGDARTSYDVWADEIAPFSVRTDAGASERRDTAQPRSAQPPTPPQDPGGRQGSDRSQPHVASRTRGSDEDAAEADESLPW
jgi:single-strand DNA-binding protein